MQSEIHAKKGDDITPTEIEEHTVSRPIQATSNKLTLQKVVTNEKPNNITKPTLTTIPEELVKKIIENLDKVPSACLSVTARKFYRIHKQVHGRVWLSYGPGSAVYYEDKKLVELLNTWMEERGFVYVIEVQMRSYKVYEGGWREDYLHNFSPIFMSTEWVKRRGNRGRKLPGGSPWDDDPLIYIHQIGLYSKPERTGEDYEAMEFDRLCGEVEVEEEVEEDKYIVEGDE